jgi:hypothetical protein
MKVYLGKQRKDAMGNVTTIHGTALQLVRRVENEGHKPKRIITSHHHAFLMTSETEGLVLVVQPPQ